jgi:hypothetical protein
MSDMYSTLHQSDIPCSKGEINSKESQRHPYKGNNPKEISGRGSSPKERTTLFH